MLMLKAFNANIAQATRGLVSTVLCTYKLFNLMKNGAGRINYNNIKAFKIS